MAVESRVFSIPGLIAEVDLSAQQFKMVKITAENTVNLPTVKGEGILGILQNKPRLGEAADVMALGVSKLVAGAGGLAAAVQYETAVGGTGLTIEAGKIANGYVLIGAAEGELASVTIGLPGGVTSA